MDEKIALFTNGIAFFGNSELIYSQSIFEKNDMYNCKYCWGKYQQKSDRLTVFKPLPVGILNLPGSYKIQEFKYRIGNNSLISITDPGLSIPVKKEKLFIDPDKCWIRVKAKK